MKRLPVIIAVLVAAALPLSARDFKETEQILKSILSEETVPLKKTNGAAVEKKQIEPQKTEKIQPDKTSAVEIEKEGKGEKLGKKEKQSLGMSQSDEVLLKTGIQFYNSGLYTFSLKQFSELITKHADSQFKDSAAMYSGKILMKQHQYDKAIEYFSSIQEKSGEYPISLYFTAETLVMKGDPNFSIEYYMKVAGQFPDHELSDDALLKIGKIYLNHQKGEQALDSTLTLIKYYGDRETIDDAYFMLGTIFMRDPVLKDFEKARRIYKIFLGKAEAGDVHFSKSPLRMRVKSDLLHIEKKYYRLEQ